jgi:hypothetical protein
MARVVLKDHWKGLMLDERRRYGTPLNPLQKRKA